MALNSAWNMYIFRDGKTAVRGDKLSDQLIEGLLSFNGAKPAAPRTQLLDLLLRAGELECALADAVSANLSLVASVTDDLANALVAGLPVDERYLARKISAVEPPEYVTVTATEGFAYYALHPLDFVDVIKRVQLRSSLVGVIGIRSIGTTISAVVQAALREQGIHAERTTIRPYGHPYDRDAKFDDHQARWITSLCSRQAEFFVVDEGPGMSGSSFLSVGDALLSSGVQRPAISFLGSRMPDPHSLTAPHAAARWPSFRAHYTQPTRYLPQEADKYVAGGIWRAEAFTSEDDWPASWLQMERLKFLSKDRQTLFKFEGIGRFGVAVYDRAQKIHNAGFGPMPMEREEGFGAYRMLHGRLLTEADSDSFVLQRLAEYCAFRSTSMHVSHNPTPELQTMLRFNAQEEFGVNLPDEISELRVERPVIADGRMLPHKWIEADGALIKVDSATHGDDHFFPGPTDIAWDLAGTIIEWNLDYSRARYFLDCYRRRSQDNPDPRLPAYLLAYSVFRMAYCKMAAAASKGVPEELRLVRGYARYRSHAKHYVQQVSPESVTPMRTQLGSSPDVLGTSVA
jgi:hypothetical protein